MPRHFRDDEEEATVPCPHCREEIHEDSQWCPHCEQFISAEDGTVVGKPMWWTAIALVCLLLVALWILRS